MSIDSFHVSDFVNLSTSGLRAMCLFCKVCEKYSRWPRALGYLSMPMLEKDSGGFRLIGVFPAVVRIWSKARSDIVSRWESSSLDAPYFAAQKGSGAEDVAWHVGSRMEAVATRKATV